MTPEEISAITAAGDLLRANPMPWEDLPQEASAVLAAALMPAPSFTLEQRGYLNLWWLPVSQEGLSALNALCPPDTILTARAQVDGSLYLNADLLSDALEGGRLAALLPILKTMTLTYFLPEDWPVSSPP